jgi:thioredoxin 1|tara:strand:+ start:113 stop:433 length:321 start_codon:yes stop_codon:yes gene_type:complete
MNVVTITDDNFESEVINSEKPVLVDYWATWCGPCKMVGPIVEEMAIEFSDKLKVGKLDVDSNQASAVKFNVMSIPTLAIFKEGEMVAQQVGALSKKQLTEFIESNL